MKSILDLTKFAQRFCYQKNVRQELQKNCPKTRSNLANNDRPKVRRRWPKVGQKCPQFEWQQCPQKNVRDQQKVRNRGQMLTKMTN